MSLAIAGRARRRISWFVALALILATVFVRLGFWQLDRLDQRRALNAQRRAALAQPPLDYAQVLRSTDAADRQVIVRGAPDYANDILLTGRSRNGSPGVHVLTPVRVSGSDTAVLINRGWIYAADAATVDLTRWTEDRTTFRGYTRRIDASAPTVTPRGRGVRSLNRDALRGLLPYPVHDVYVVSQDSSTANAPARLPGPDLGEGPHLGYAVQWFAFAAIAVVGAGIVVFRARGHPTTGPTGA
jgi:surfeit locus 1 family protein